jgi:VCBS repeat-containing protein
LLDGDVAYAIQSDSSTISADPAYAGQTPVNVSVINLDDENAPPSAIADTYTVVHDTVLSVAAPGILGNDSDFENDPLTVANPTPMGSGSFFTGTLLLNADGSFLYTPVTRFVGAISFTYQITDGFNLSAPALVTITVTNQAPQAVADVYTTAQNTPLVVAGPGVLSNDSDPDGDSFSASVITSPTHGSLTLDMHGAFHYTPTLDFVGSDNFTYQITDTAGATASADVTIAIEENVADNHMLYLPIVMK